MLYNGGETWVVKLHGNKTGEVVEEHDTGIPTTDEQGNRDNYDYAAIAKCYEWLYSVRDKYTRDHVELRKPVVVRINAANQKAVGLNQEIVEAETAGDTDFANQKRGELQQHLKAANAEIKQATAEMNAVMGGAIQ